MRRGWMLGGLLVVLALGAMGAAWHASGSASRPATPGAAPSPGAMAGLFQALLSDRPAPPAGTTALGIRGRVKDARGPVAGARVLVSATVPEESLSELRCPGNPAHSLIECYTPGPFLEAMARRAGEAPVQAETRSDADGAFVLEGLEPGRYALWVESPQGVVRPRDVLAGVEGVELVLEPGVTVSGVVSGEDEAPLAGARVTVIYAAHSRFFETVSDDAGRFTVGPLPRGAYAVHGSREGLVPVRFTFMAYTAERKLEFSLLRPRRLTGTVLHGGTPVAGVGVRTRIYAAFDDVETRTDAQGRFALEGLAPQTEYTVHALHDGLKGALEVELKAPEGSVPAFLGERTGLRLELTPAVALRGSVRDEAGAPLAQAQVQVSRKEGEEFSYDTSVATDEEGHYVLEGLEPGSFRLEVEAEGFLAPEAQTLEGVEKEGRADFRLSRATRLVGVLVDADGQPASNEGVNLTSPDGELAFSAVSNEEGRFAFDLERAGPYHLQLPGRKIREQSRVDVSAPGDVRVRVERLPRVRGVVMDETGMPLPGVELSIWDEDPRERKHHLAYGSSDEGGRFDLHAPRAGRYQLSAEFAMRDFMATTRQPLEVGPHGADVEVRLGSQGHALSGVVVDSRGQPLEGVQVELVSELRAELLRCGLSATGSTTGPDGRFHFPRITGDSLAVKLRKDLYAVSCAKDERQQLFPLEPGDSDVRIVLVKRAYLYGRIVGEDGAPMDAYTFNGMAVSRSEGRFSWPIRCTGTQTLELSASRPGAVPVRRTVSVQEEEKFNLGTIVLTP